MPNLAKVLKDEIARLARKELRTELNQTRKLVAGHRRDIAALKRQITALERRLKVVNKTAAKAASVTAEEVDQPQIRFSAKGFKSHRQRLGLSAADYGRLLGVTQLTVYNWEQGKSRPRQSNMASIAAVRELGKREALRKLEEMAE